MTTFGISVPYGIHIPQMGVPCDCFHMALIPSLSLRIHMFFAIPNKCSYKIENCLWLMTQKEKEMLENVTQAA